MSQMLFRTQIFCSLTAYNNYWISVNNIPVRCANLAIKAGCRSNRSRIRALLISEIKKIYDKFDGKEVSRIDPLRLII